MPRDKNDPIRKNQYGVYCLRVPVANTGKKRWISTNERDRQRAIEVVKESGADRLIALANARALTQETISLVTLGHTVLGGDALTHWLEWVRPRLAPSTYLKYSQNVRMFLENHGALNDSLNTVQEIHVDQWINNGVSPRATRLGRLVPLKLFFKFCNARGLIVGNPAILVEVNFRDMTVEQIEGKHTQPFTEEEYQRLLAYEGLPDFWRAAVTLAYCTGLRMIDCACLEWASFTATEIIVYPQKTRGAKKRLVLPLSDPLICRPELRALIDRLLAITPRDDATWVFPDYAEQYRRHSAMLSFEFKRHAKAAGVFGLTFHGLRAGCFTRLRAAGKTIEQVAETAGHSSVEMTKVYTGESTP